MSSVDLGPARCKISISSVTSARATASAPIAPAETRTSRCCSSHARSVNRRCGDRRRACGARGVLRATRRRRPAPLGTHRAARSPASQPDRNRAAPAGPLAEVARAGRRGARDRELGQQLAGARGGVGEAAAAGELGQRVGGRVLEEARRGVGIARRDTQLGERGVAEAATWPEVESSCPRVTAGASETFQHAWRGDATRGCGAPDALQQRRRLALGVRRPRVVEEGFLRHALEGDRLGGVDKRDRHLRGRGRGGHSGRRAGGVGGEGGGRAACACGRRETC